MGGRGVVHFTEISEHKRNNAVIKALWRTERGKVKEENEKCRRDMKPQLSWKFFWNRLREILPNWYFLELLREVFKHVHLLLSSISLELGLLKRRYTGIDRDYLFLLLSFTSWHLF